MTHVTYHEVTGVVGASSRYEGGGGDPSTLTQRVGLSNGALVMLAPATHRTDAENATTEDVLALERSVREEEEEARLLRALIERTHLERQRKLEGVLHDAEGAQHRLDTLRQTNDDLYKELQTTRQRREHLQRALLAEQTHSYSEENVAKLESTLKTLRAHLELERRTSTPSGPWRADQVIAMLREQVEALVKQRQEAGFPVKESQYFTSEPQRRLQLARSSQKKLLDELSQVKAAITQQRRHLDRLLERRQQKKPPASTPVRQFSLSPRHARGGSATVMSHWSPLERSVSHADSSLVVPNTARPSTSNTHSPRPSALIVAPGAHAEGKTRSWDSDEQGSSNTDGNVVLSPLTSAGSPKYKQIIAAAVRGQKPPLRHGETVRELRIKLRQLQHKAATIGREKITLQIEHVAKEVTVTQSAADQLCEALSQETRYKTDLRDACAGLRNRIQDIRADLQNMSHTTRCQSNAANTSTTSWQRSTPSLHINAVATGGGYQLTPRSHEEDCGIAYHGKVLRERSAVSAAYDQTLLRIITILGRTIQQVDSDTPAPSVGPQQASPIPHVLPQSPRPTNPIATPRRSAAPMTSPRRSTVNTPRGAGSDAVRLEHMQKLVGNLKMTLYRMKTENAQILRAQAIRSKSSHSSSGPPALHAHRATRMSQQKIKTETVPPSPRRVFRA